MRSRNSIQSSKVDTFHPHPHPQPLKHIHFRLRFFCLFMNRIFVLWRLFRFCSFFFFILCGCSVSSTMKEDRSLMSVHQYEEQKDKECRQKKKQKKGKHKVQKRAAEKWGWIHTMRDPSNIHGKWMTAWMFIQDMEIC